MGLATGLPLHENLMVDPHGSPVGSIYDAYKVRQLLYSIY
jgi:hypothetical protein